MNPRRNLLPILVLIARHRNVMSKIGQTIPVVFGIPVSTATSGPETNRHRVAPQADSRFRPAMTVRIII